MYTESAEHVISISWHTWISSFWPKINNFSLPASTQSLYQTIPSLLSETSFASGILHVYWRGTVNCSAISTFYTACLMLQIFDWVKCDPIIDEHRRSQNKAPLLRDINCSFSVSGWFALIVASLFKKGVVDTRQAPLYTWARASTFSWDHIRCEFTLSSSYPKCM